MKTYCVLRIDVRIRNTQYEPKEPKNKKRYRNSRYRFFVLLQAFELGLGSGEGAQRQGAAAKDQADEKYDNQVGNKTNDDR